MASRSRYKTKHQRSNLRLIIYFAGGVALVFTLILFIIGDYGLYQLYQLKKAEKNTAAHIERLKILQDSLLVEQERLEKDLKYIEKLAREKYRMAKKGEKVFKVIDPHSSKK